MRKTMLLLVSGLAVACGSGEERPAPPQVIADTPAEHIAGEVLFAANCQQCHGVRATGSSQGPPLVHRIYEPGHHADESFYRAAAMGARAHHWGFGDMAPVPGLTREDVGSIIGYVRWLQREAGIL